MIQNEFMSAEREIISRFAKVVRDEAKQLGQEINDMADKYQLTPFPSDIKPGDEKVVSFFEDNIRKETDRIRQLIEEFRSYNDAGYSWYILGSSLRGSKTIAIEVQVIPYREGEPPVDEADITGVHNTLRWRDTKIWATEMNIAQVELLHSKKLLSLCR